MEGIEQQKVILIRFIIVHTKRSKGDKPTDKIQIVWFRLFEEMAQ